MQDKTNNLRIQKTPMRISRRLNYMGVDIPFRILMVTIYLNYNKIAPLLPEDTFLAYR